MGKEKIVFPVTHKFSFPQIKTMPFDRKRVIVTEDYRFAFEGERYTIPAGFIFDGASIPRLFWTSTGTPFEPEHLTAGGIHDFFYWNAAVSRKKADKFFHELLLKHGESRYTSRKMYLAVRSPAGWWAWRKWRKLDGKKVK